MGPDQRGRPSVIHGKSASHSAFSAAQEMREKHNTVFCVDNVGTDCSVDQMNSFITGLSVEDMLWDNHGAGGTKRQLWLMKGISRLHSWWWSKSLQLRLVKPLRDDRRMLQHSAGELRECGGQERLGVLTAWTNLNHVRVQAHTDNDLPFHRAVELFKEVWQHQWWHTTHRKKWILQVLWMMESNNVASNSQSLISFNMHGFDQGLSLIQDIINSENPDEQPQFLVKFVQFI